MQLPFSEQVVRFVDNHGVKMLAALGVSKAVEVLVLYWFPSWLWRVVVFLLLSVGVLWVAARSNTIDL